MRRKTPRRLSMKQAFAVLDLALPKIKGATQAEVDAKLKEWKNTVLKSGYRSKVKEVHPDQNAGDPEAGAKFKEVQEAFEQIRDDLKINLKRPVTTTPSPSVSFTHCPSCGIERVPEQAKFCHDCGTSYLMDALERRLRGQGVTDRTIQQIKFNGTYDRLNLLPPVSPELQQEIELLLQRQRLGLYGQFSGWK